MAKAKSKSAIMDQVREVLIRFRLIYSVFVLPDFTCFFSSSFRRASWCSSARLRAIYRRAVRKSSPYLMRLSRLAFTSSLFFRLVDVQCCCVQVLQTPSHSVQESAGKCIAPLISAVPVRNSLLVVLQRLFSLVFYGTCSLLCSERSRAVAGRVD